MAPKDHDVEETKTKKDSADGLDNRYEQALAQVLETVLQDPDDNEKNKGPKSSCVVLATEKKTLVGDESKNPKSSGVVLADTEKSLVGDTNLHENHQSGSSTTERPQSANADFKGDKACATPCFVRNDATEVGPQSLGPGAYNIVNPDAQPSDNGLETGSESFSLEDDPEEEVDTPIQDIPLEGMLVQDQGDRNGGDQDEEIGGVQNEESDNYVGELIEDVKVEETARFSRLPLSLGVAMILILLVVVIFLILGLSGVIRLEDSSSDELDDFGGEPLNDEASLSTIQQIQRQGYLPCSYTEFPGIIYKDENGRVTGFLATFYYAVAAALKVEAYFYPKSELYGTKDYFWVRTHNMERQVNESYSYTTPVIYSGLQMGGDPFFIENCVDKGLSYVGNCSQLRVCVDFESAHYKVLTGLMPRRYLFPIDLVNATVFTGLVEGTCNVIAIESFFMAPPFAIKAGYEKPYTISKSAFSHDPIGFVTPSDDPEFSDLVNSVVQALILAEKRNITKETADLFPLTTLFGADNQDMFQRVIRTVGNLADAYASLEILVPRSSLNMINGGDTGLIYSHPFGEISLKREAPLGPSLREILTRGTLRCGIRVNRTGFVTKMAGPTYSGMDVDYCCALAASLFSGDSTAVDFVELQGSADGFQRLANGSLDVMAGAPWTIENDVKEPTTGLGFSFSQPYFYGYSAEEDSLSLATRQGQDDHDWTSFVYWTVGGTFYAEESGLNRSTSNEMPLVELFGHNLHRMFRNAILAVGSYSDIYNRNMEDIVPRGGRNMLNRGPTDGHYDHSGQHYAITGF